MSTWALSRLHPKPNSAAAGISTPVTWIAIVLVALAGLMLIEAARVAAEPPHARAAARPRGAGWSMSTFDVPRQSALPGRSSSLSFRVGKAIDHRRWQHGGRRERLAGAAVDWRRVALRS